MMRLNDLKLWGQNRVKFWSVISCVALGKLLIFCDFSFLICEMEHTGQCLPKIIGRIKWGYKCDHGRDNNSTRRTKMPETLILSLLIFKSLDL